LWVVPEGTLRARPRDKTPCLTLPHGTDMRVHGTDLRVRSSVTADFVGVPVHCMRDHAIKPPASLCLTAHGWPAVHYWCYLLACGACVAAARLVAARPERRSAAHLAAMARPVLPPHEYMHHHHTRYLNHRAAAETVQSQCQRSLGQRACNAYCPQTNRFGVSQSLHLEHRASASRRYYSRW